MDNPSPEITQERFDKLFKEYQICNDHAARLESYIWQTATLLGIGSAIGLVSLASAFAGTLTSQSGNKISQYHATITIIAAIFGINVSLVWWRFARRWWSIQHLKFARMNEIESLIEFQQSTRVGMRDREAMCHIFYMRDHGKWCYQRWINKWCYSIPDDCAIQPAASQHGHNYEHRGNQPAGFLLILTNSGLWLFFSLHIACKTGLFLYALLAFISVAILDFCFWRRP
jgi:hypothetical protein